MRIAIIGGAGNLGTLMAAIFANRGNEVIIHTSKPQKISNTLEVYDSDDELLYVGNIVKATSDWEEAIITADLIWITLPPQLFSQTAKNMEPYVRSGQMVGVVPGAGGAEYAFQPLIKKKVRFFGLARVPSIARLKEYGKSVYLLGAAPELLVGSIPASDASRICRDIQPLYEIKCRPVANYLTVALTPSNPVLHTSRIYAMFKNYVDGVKYPKNELFYEGWTIEGAEVLLACSDELQELCKAIPMDLRDVESMQKRHEIRTPKELAYRIRSLERLKGLYSPVKKMEKGYVPDFDSRYFASDFPYGIKIIIEIANLFDVDTPTMDEIWEWFVKVQPRKAREGFVLMLSKEEFIDFYMGK